MLLINIYKLLKYLIEINIRQNITVFLFQNYN